MDKHMQFQFFRNPSVEGIPFEHFFIKETEHEPAKGREEVLQSFHGYVVKQVWWPCWDRKQYKVHLSKNHSRKSLPALISGPALLNGGG